MKNLIRSASILTISLSVSLQAADVGLSINIGQPEFYGRIEIDGYPQPKVLYQQPRSIYRGYENRNPIYMRFPPGHIKDWRQHCKQYNACNERVYFVQDTWYNQEFPPRYQAQHPAHGKKNDLYGGSDQKKSIPNNVNGNSNPSKNKH